MFGSIFKRGMIKFCILFRVCLLCFFEIKKCFFTPQTDDDVNEIHELDNINESSDLVASQNGVSDETAENGENGENGEPGDDNSKTINGKENGYHNENGNRTDDDTASESGTSQRSEVVDYTKSTEYKELMKEIKQDLVCAVRLQLKNHSALVRRVAVLLLDFLGTTTLGIDAILTSNVSYMFTFHENRYGISILFL